MLYYAVITDGHVSSVITSETAITMENYVQITAEQYADSSLVGKRYDPYTGNFTDVIYWIGSTDEMEYGNTEMILTDKIHQIEDSIENISLTPGDSAYKVAVANGFEGTEQEWLASLVGATGAQGVQGEKGEKGDQGIQGEKGDKGDKGDTGAQGVQGIQGIQGEKGDKGDKGDTGEQGLQGEKGDKGDKGDTGAAGQNGADGQDGADGTTVTVGTTTTGAAGTNAVVSGTLDETTNTLTLNFTIPKGDTGAKGDKGDKGDTGAQGAQGVQGLQGIQGEKGDKGDTGAQGAKGDKGDTGAQGVQGVQGVQGEKGDKGDKGDTGAAGQDGADGTTVVVGTTTTGAAGTNASVTGSFNPQTNTLTLNFTIPRGETGATGATGAAGTNANLTADEILARLKTIDGQNSGLDADLLDGHNADYFATATQLAGKAPAVHTHDYAASSHTHAQSEVTGLETALGNKANTNHTHTAAGIGAAALNHNHDLSEIALFATEVTAVGTNLNNYTTGGIFSFSVASAPLNMPPNNTNGWLIVLPWSEGSGTVKQIWLRHGTTNSTDSFIYTRLHTNVAGWGNWSVVYTAQNPPTAAEVGAINKNLQVTSDTGDVFVSWSGKDVVAQFKALASGMRTAYSPIGATNNPNSEESFRFMCHKTGSANYGWIMAYGGQGSVYTGYVDNGNWKGWKCIYDANPQPLWTGASYMTEVHTITPSKALSECRNGWLLLWSDYDPGSGANNTDFAASVIPKRAYTGQKWNGGQWYCDVPRYSAGSATDSEGRSIKLLLVHDTKIIGTEHNSAAPRNDIVLRAVYEW